MHTQDIELPQSVVDELATLRNDGPGLSKLLLEKFSQIIAERRNEAVTYRQNIGIEDTWINCEEAYLGIDDANRHLYLTARWAKSSTKEGPVYTNSKGEQPGEEVRSTGFVKLTARYVNAGKAKVGEIVLALDDKSFAFSATPVPILSDNKDSTDPVVDEETGEPLQRNATKQEIAQDAENNVAQQPPGQNAQQPPGQNAQQPPGQVPQKPMEVRDLIKEAGEKAAVSAKKAERRIYDQLIECKHTSEMRKVIFDGARLGTGVLKGPFPKMVRGKKVTKGESGLTMEIVENVRPATKWVDLWNFFPDPACGENIHDGDYILERDFISRKQLRALKKQPGYHSDLIDQVIQEGPSKNTINMETQNPIERENKGRWARWHYYGVISKEDFELVNSEEAKVMPGGQEDVYAILTLVNDTVIYGSLNQLESGEFPFHTFTWERRVGYWAGVGVAEQINFPQRLINAATRAMSNNAGKSAGAQIVMDRNAITPADGQWQLTPDKLWYVGADSTYDDVRKAFKVFDFPNNTNSFMKIIEYAFKLGEESTSIPLVTQGQSGKTSPETFGATQLQNNNANQLLRDIGYSIDEGILESLIRQMYEWNLLDPDVPDDEKGDFQIQAHGSAALAERVIQDQSIMEMSQLAGNPIYGVDPKKWFAVMSKSKKLNPLDFQYSEEEMKRMAETPPPPPPQVMAAQIRAQIEQMKLKAKGEELQLSQDLERELAALDVQMKTELSSQDTDRDTEYVQALTDRAQVQAQTRIMELELKRDLAIMDHASKRDLSLEQVKAELAKTAMKLNVTKELAALDAETKDGGAPRQQPPSSPVVEPAGRAEPGQSFQQ